MASTNAARALSQRLRTLRERHWADVSITQRQLAEALRISVPSISSWEKPVGGAVPPEQRLREYARFFATRRSVAGRPFRLLDDGELDAPERAARQALETELLDLREEAFRDGSAGRHIETESPGGIATGPWHFDDDELITIVCAKLPPDLLAGMPYTRPEEPDYTELYTYADLDALFELHGHVRAVNPASEVRYKSASSLQPDDFASHLVVLGGVDWNVATRRLLDLLDVPVRQASRETDPAGHFAVGPLDSPQEFHPVLTEAGTLTEDIAHFFRGPNPFNHKRTVTICNGQFSRGVLGAVRALTDKNFRKRNADHVVDRFPAGDTFSILARVRVVDGAVLTPDWTLAETRLHEWPEA